MINLTNVFLESAPSRIRLPFGINNNVILKSVDNEERRDKNSAKIAKNCYITFASVDPENDNKITAERVFSYFNIDSDRPQYAVGNFIQQYNQLMEILKAVIPADSLMEAVTPFGAVLNEHEDVFKAVASDSGVPTAKTVKAIIAAQKAIVDSFVEIILPFSGENSDLCSLTVVTGTNGKYFELPREHKGFICKMGEGELLLEAKYKRWYAERDVKKKETPDKLGKGEDIVSEEDLIADTEDDFDDI